MGMRERRIACGAGSKWGTILGCFAHSRISEHTSHYLEESTMKITAAILFGAFALALAAPGSAQTTSPPKTNTPQQQEPSSHTGHADTTNAKSQDSTQSPKEVAKEMQEMGKRMQEHGMEMEKMGKEMRTQGMHMHKQGMQMMNDGTSKKMDMKKMDMDMDTMEKHMEESESDMEEMDMNMDSMGKTMGMESGHM